MARPWILALVLVPTLAGVPACGGGNGGGGGSKISLADYSAQWLDADCARSARCGGYSDKASCLSSRQPGFGQVSTDIDAGKRTFDGVAASKCLDYMRAFVDAPCTFSGQGQVLTDPSCGAVFKGTFETGAACSDGGQCKSGSCAITGCSGTPLCCMGTCDRVTAPVQIGGACMYTGACVSGAYCRGATDTTAGACAATIAAGQPCDASIDVCAPGTLCSSSVCVALPAEGQPCTSVCDELADFCDFQATMTCVHKRGVGQPCPNGYGCVDHALCAPATQTCVARVNAGDTCDASQAGACLGALQCTNGTCAFPAPSGTCP